MKLILITIMTLMTVACEGPVSPPHPPNVVTGPGYVRSLHAAIVNDSHPPRVETQVVFEHDDGRLNNYDIWSDGDLPVWVGMHCSITMSPYYEPDFVSVIRLGPDAHK